MNTADAGNNEAGTVVKCPAGAFRGSPDNGAVQFLGIRYASSERFGAPVPYRYPDGIHDAVTPCPLAVQVSSQLVRNMLGVDVGTVRQEESCQYLSLTVPEGSGGKLPVMVWIHGGAFEVGGCDLGDRLPLATECNVIVVGIGYRLGVLGFLRDRDGRLANNGLLDIIEGLRWVRENISSFGGDPDNITLFGESAGAEAVRCIMLSDGTGDLYRRAILQSDPMGSMTGRTAMTGKMLEELNLMPVDADVEEVKRVQASILSHVTEKGPAKYLKFGPNYGVFPLPKESEVPDRVKSIAPGHDIIIGTNAREVAVFVSTSKRIVSMDRSVLTRWLIEAIFRRITGKMFAKPAEAFAREYAACGGRVNLYRFYWMKDHDYIGACHASDVQLLFGAEGTEGMDI